MNEYKILISYEDFQKITEPNRLASFKGGYTLIGSKWFDIFENQICIKEGEPLRD